MATERARARANIDRKTWRKWGQGQKDTTKDGAETSVPRARQGQKLMTKHGGNGGKGKNDTLKLR